MESSLAVFRKGGCGTLGLCSSEHGAAGLTVGLYDPGGIF